MEFIIVILLLVLIFVLIFRRELSFMLDLTVTLGVIAFILWGLWSLLSYDLVKSIVWGLSGLGMYYWIKDYKEKRRRKSEQLKGE